jgi:hypothetical protein
MTELFEFFEQVCLETSIPLNKEIQTDGELKLLLEDRDNYAPLTRACRSYKHVLDTLMQKAATESTQAVVSELSDVVFGKLRTCPIDQIQYGITNIGEWSPEPFGDIEEPVEALHLVQWLFDLQTLSNFRQYLDSRFSTDTMEELKECLDVFYSNNNE